MDLRLARHGETEWNVRKWIQGGTDTPLNENGILQARQLADRLLAEGFRPARIYTSPMRRALDTALIVSDILEAECVPRPGLEEINFGLWEGLTWDQVQERYPDEFRLWYENRRYQRTPQGESYQDLLDRMLPVLSDIVQREGGPDASCQVLVVAHSASVMSLLSWVYDTPFSEMVSRYRTQNAHAVILDAARFVSPSLPIKT